MASTFAAALKDADGYLTARPTKDSGAAAAREPTLRLLAPLYRVTVALAIIVALAAGSAVSASAAERYPMSETVFVHNRPSTAADTRIGKVWQGERVEVLCQDNGPTVNGNPVWDYIQYVIDGTTTTKRGFVADYHVRTGVVGALPGVPFGACVTRSASPAPSDPPAPPAADLWPGAAPRQLSFKTPTHPGLGRYRIGFFIMQDSYGALGITGAGDGRSFDPSMGPSDNRLFVDIDYESGNSTVVVNPSCNSSRTSCTSPVDLPPERVSITHEENRRLFPNKDVKVHLSVPNSREAINGWPPIRAELTFWPAVAGTGVSYAPTVLGTMCVSGSISSFPSMEIYRDTAQGTTLVYRHQQSRIAGAAALGIQSLDSRVSVCIPPAR